MTVSAVTTAGAGQRHRRAHLDPGSRPRRGRGDHPVRRRGERPDRALVRLLCRPVGLVGRAPGAVLGDRLGLLRHRRRRHPRTPSWPTPPCPAPAGSPGPGSTTPSTRCGPARSRAGRTPWRSPRSMRTAPRPRRRGPSCAPRSPPSPAGCARRGSGPVTGSSATCPTPPRPWSPSSPAPASARSGPPAGRTTRPRVRPHASPSSSRWCSSPPTATGGTAGSSTGGARWPRWRGRCPRCAPPSACPTWACPTAPAGLGRNVVVRLGRRSLAGGHGHPRRAPVRAGAVRRAAVGAVLLGHDRAAEGHRARPRRGAARALQAARPAHGPGPGPAALLVHDHQLDDVEHGRLRPAGRSAGRPLRRQPGPSRTRNACGRSPPTNGWRCSGSARATCSPARRRAWNRAATSI